jgi:acetoin utilization protein AcuB
MIAAELISQVMSPLRTSDTGEDALTIMHVYHVKHLPIVNNELLLGTISEDDIMNHDLSEPIGSYGLSLIKGYVNRDDHLFEVLGKMAEYKLTSIPVTDDDDKYLGAITQEDLIQYYADSFSFKEPGSILVLEMPKRNYSLAEISRIIEGENIAIFSTFLSTKPDSEQVFVTIKINRQDAQQAIATLERYGYTIKASFAEATYFEDMKERYDALMNYLNV